MWIYDEGWVVCNEDEIRTTYQSAGVAYDSARASVWNARCVSQAASGLLTRQEARWTMLNALRVELNAQHGKSLPALLEPLWCGEEVGALRVEGLNVLNDGTPFGTVPWMLRGYRMFDTLCLHLYGIRDFQRSLDYPARLGFNTVFVSSTMFAPNGHPATLDPRVNTDVYDKLSECADITKSRGMRLWAYAVADCGPSRNPNVNLPEPDQHTHWLKHAQRISGGYHIPAVANEGPNGNSTDQNAFPAPPNCPLWTRGSSGENPPTGPAPAAEVEVKRRGENDQNFKEAADAASVKWQTLDPQGPKLNRPIFRVEDTFAAEVDEDGRRSSKPAIFVATAAAAAATRLWGSGGSAFGCDDGRLGKAPGLNQDRCARAAVIAMRQSFTG